MIIYLYVKQHTITKLKYFGVTKKKNPFKYIGSGTYWNRHISKYGKDRVKTLEVWGFDDLELCRDFALTFSQDNDIVTSADWANLVIEDTIIRYTGGSAKHSASAKNMWNRSDYREKQTEARIQAWQNEPYRHQQSLVRKNNWQDPEYRAKTIAAGKKARKNDSYLQNQRNKAKQQWSDPEFRERELMRRKLTPKKIWINNGDISKTIPYNTEMPHGFVLGRLYRRKS